MLEIMFKKKLIKSSVILVFFNLRKIDKQHVHVFTNKSIGS